MAKYAAKGAILAYLSTPPSTYTTIPGVQDFDFSFGESERIDVTSHDSPGDYSENVAGLKEHQPFTPTIVWDDTDTHHKALVTAHGAGTKLSLRITARGGTTHAVDAYVTNITLSEPVRGAQTASVTFLPTGARTDTAPGS